MPEHQFSFMSSSGFTLIEIIVSMVIIGLVLAISIPGLRSFNEIQILQGETDKMVASIKQAQSFAQTNSQPTTTCTGTLTWRVLFQSSSNYKIQSICTDSSGNPGSANDYSNTTITQGVSYWLTNCSYSSTIDFIRNSIVLSCGSGSNEIVLWDPTASQLRRITINQGGSISVTNN